MDDNNEIFRVNSLEQRVSSLESKMVSVQTIVKTAEKGVHVDYITAHDRVGTENRNDSLLGTGTIQILEDVVFGNGVQLSAPSIQLTAGTPLTISNDIVIGDENGNLGFQTTGVIPCDPRIKTDITDITEIDEKAIIRRFEGPNVYRYRYNPAAASIMNISPNKYVYGFMANEFFENYPDSVEKRNLSEKGLPSDTYLINLQKEMIHRDLPIITRYLLRENRELKTRIDTLENIVKELKRQVGKND